MSTHAPAAKRFLKRWSRRLFALAALGLHPARRRELLPGLRILTYHRLADDPRDPFAVRPQDFIRQMKVLSEHGGVVALEGALSQAGGGGGNAPRIAVTFDDGTVDFSVVAASFQIGLGIPATLYLNPSTIGTSGFLDWKGLAELASSGVRLGSHGLEHLSLARLPRGEIRRQVADSRSILQDRLGIEVSSLAYPYGTVRDFNSIVKEEVHRAGYRSACTSVNGVNGVDADLLELRRTKVEQGDSPVFDWLLGGCMDGWAFIDRHLAFIQSRYV